MLDDAGDEGVRPHLFLPFGFWGSFLFLFVLVLAVDVFLSHSDLLPFVAIPMFLVLARADLLDVVHDLLVRSLVLVFSSSRSW